jgi:rhodanese-related sulfurtransferase
MSSHTAAERAVEAGFKNVAVMVGGFHDWKEAGQPITQPAPAP